MAESFFFKGRTPSVHTDALSREAFVKKALGRKWSYEEGYGTLYLVSRLDAPHFGQKVSVFRSKTANHPGTTTWSSCSRTTSTCSRR